MALRTIRTVGDDILGKKSRPVEVFDVKLHQLLDDMRDTMNRENGVGIAAVQVGVLKRALIIDLGDNLLEFINPRIVSDEGLQQDWEGCLSIPGERGLVERPAKTVVAAQNRFGEAFEMTCEGRLAVAFHHELDHLNGILYIERALEMADIDEDYDEDDE